MRKETPSYMLCFFRELCKSSPFFNSNRVVICVDREPGFTKAIKDICPNLNIFYCWNHLIKDVEVWLTGKGHKGDVQAYKAYVRVKHQKYFIEKLMNLNATGLNCF